MAPRLSCHSNLLILLSLLFLSFPARHVWTLPLPPPKHAAGPREKTESSEPPAPAATPSASSLVRTCCAKARYPSLCIHTLSSSQLPANSTPADLALAAISASSTSSRSAAAFLSRLLSAASPAPGELKDCRDQLADSTDQLEKTAKEIHRLRPETFRWQLDNMQTWVSAAMTNQDTCVQGIQGGGPGAAAEPVSAERSAGSGAASAVVASTREAVVTKVSGVSQLTSNALYLVNRLGSTKGRRRL